MLFPWKKHSAISANEKNSLPQKLREKLRLSTPENKSVIRFTNVDLSPSIKELNCNIEQGSWMFLAGPDDFGKALFCDLCFNFIQPEKGEVHPKMQGSEVSFLGRSNTTYGSALLDHLYSGVKEHSKELVVHVIENVFSKNLKKNLSPNNPLIFANSKIINEIELSERDFLEIAEANIILQNRAAVIIDTTTDFYRIALEQGFQHSNLLLDAGKTIFWIINDSQKTSKEQSPWKTQSKAKTTSLYFVNEGLVNHIN